VPLVFYSGVQPVLQAHPYLVPLIDNEQRGARAIVEAVARRLQNSISDHEWMLYAYALVNIYGDDANGRNAAIALIDRMENDLPKNANLEVLRQRVRTAKRVLFR